MRTFQTALEVHAGNAACLFSTTDFGSMGTFDAYSGSSGCTKATSSESDITDTSLETCSGKKPITRRSHFQALNIVNGTVSGIKLTILTSKGQPVPGYIGLNVTVGVPINLTSLTLNDTEGSAQYQLIMVQPITGTPVVPYSLTYYGPGPEVCFTVIPTINETGKIPILARTINKGPNMTDLSYGTTIDAQPCSINVTGTAWLDNSPRNGVKESGEAGYANKALKTQLPSGSWLATMTDTAGNFVFTLPSIMPNRTFIVLDGVSNATLGSFTTNAQGTTYALLPI